MAIEKFCLLAVPRTEPVQLTRNQGRVKRSMHDRICAATKHISNHPDNGASATQSLLMRAENCIATGGGHFEQLL